MPDHFQAHPDAFKLGGVLRLGALDHIRLHYSRHIESGEMPVALCQEGGEGLAKGLSGGSLHTFTQDREKVTCQQCIEWLRA